MEYVSYDENTKEIVISHLAVDRFLNRLDEVYSSPSDYTKHHPSKVRNMINSINDITWDNREIRFYSFFALEFYEVFTHLATEYHDKSYEDTAQELYDKTWISKSDKAETKRTPTYSLAKFTLKPQDFQLDFIEKYSGLKYAYDLDGYILGFEQGLGKTFTAVALGECLDKEIFYIVCPNSAKINWANEIRSYYKKYQNNDTWKDEIYVSGVSGYKYDRSTTKFIIVNQESIPNIFPMVDPKKNSIIIIDECQNFRGYKTKRVAAMLELKKRADCHDNLLMSGTPIKAIANEIVPALLMIDPHFTPKLADIFYNTFSDKSTGMSEIIAARFHRIMYRKLKRDVVKLPEKYVTELRLKVPHEDRYNLKKLFKSMKYEYHKEYMKRLANGLFTNNKKNPYYRTSAPDYDFLTEQSKFEKVVRTYSRANRSTTESYLDFIFQRTKDLNDINFVSASNVEDKYFKFLENYVQPFVTNSDEKEIVTTKYNGILGWATAAKSASSSVFGRMYAKNKDDCFNEIWDYNFQTIIDMINKAKKKTIIFTSEVAVANHISEGLTKNGVYNVKITGETAHRDDAISSFKERSDIQVLVATTETLGTAVTLTEANQMFFFGTPWRNADFIQACDRIHRIGQTEPCYIYNVLLFSREKNITERITEVMNWSGEMFDSLITESAYEM